MQERTARTVDIADVAIMVQHAICVRDKSPFSRED